MKKQVSVVVFTFFLLLVSTVGFSQGFVNVEVRSGWSLWDIARGTGMATKQLMELNDLKDSTIYPGQKLKVSPYSEFNRVKVSWYGSKFHGDTMANGQEFDMNDPTVVAHKWLPFGTRVRLTYKDKSIEVIVRDRGPYHGDRHFDLSRAAAKKLGIYSTGVATCKIKILS